MVGFYSSTIRYKAMTLSSAQILALSNPAVQILPACDSNKFYEVVSGLLHLKFATAYTETGANISFVYTDKDGAAASATAEGTGFWDATADALLNVYPLAANTLITDLATVLGQPLCIMAAANPAAGTGTVKVKVFYRVHILDV